MLSSKKSSQRRTRRQLSVQSLAKRELMAADLAFEPAPIGAVACVSTAHDLAIAQQRDSVSPQMNHAIEMMFASHDAAPDPVFGAGGAQAGDGIEKVQPKTEPLTNDEWKTLRNNSELKKNVNVAQKNAKQAERAVERAEKKVQAIQEKLALEHNQPQLDDLNKQLDEIQARLEELQTELQKVTDDYQRLLRAHHEQVIPIGVDENGDTIYGQADNGHLANLFNQMKQVEKEIKELTKEQQTIQKQQVKVKERVDKLNDRLEAAEMKVQEAIEKSNQANAEVDRARTEARGQVEQNKLDQEKAKAEREKRKAEKRRRAMERDLKEFEKNEFYIARAIEALQKLGLVDEGVNPAKVIQQTKDDWRKAMDSNLPGVIATVGADAATPAPGVGSAISITQAMYGILGIRASTISPSNEKAYIDATNGLVGQWNQLPILNGNVEGWLVDNYFAHPKHVEKVRKEMEKIMGVSTVDVGLNN